MWRYYCFQEIDLAMIFTGIPGHFAANTAQEGRLHI
jgi:hypothetical protein